MSAFACSFQVKDFIT